MILKLTLSLQISETCILSSVILRRVTRLLLCEQHKYYGQRNNSLLSVARYRETVSVTGAVRGNYSCVERQLLIDVKRLLLLVDSEVRMNHESKPSQTKVLRAETCAKRRSTSLRLVAIPAFDRIAELQDVYLYSTWGICYR